MLDILNISLQLLISAIIIILIIIFIIPLFFKNLDNLEEVPTAYKTVDKDYSVKIIDGYMPLNSSEEYITTKNKDDINYVFIPRSVNRYGGSEFSFSFWIMKNKNSQDPNSSLSNRTLLLFGLKNKDTLLTKEVERLESKIINNNMINEIDPLTDKTLINEDNQNYYVTQESKVIIKCPMISFDKDGKNLLVKLNTLDSIEETITIDAPILNELDNNKWSLLTFTFEDNKSSYGFASGLKITFYLNDKQVSTQILEKKEMRLNDGRIYILPKLGDESPMLSSNNGYIADVTYFNKALNLNDIKSILKQGYTTNTYKTPRMKNNDLLLKNRYNTISLYNETQEL